MLHGGPATATLAALQFIQPEDRQAPLIYQVERLRDGKSYSTLRIAAIQHGSLIFYHNDVVPC
ncbi:acyl-CoA thioesterase [Bradyrhizobium sp. GM24.11]